MSNELMDEKNNVGPLKLTGFPPNCHILLFSLFFLINNVYINMSHETLKNEIKITLKRSFVL